MTDDRGPGASSSPVLAGNTEPPWLATLRQRADQPPLRPREPLVIGTGARMAVVGSIEPQLAHTMAAAGLPMRAVEPVWRLDEPADESLQRLALWLDAQQLGSRWRNELLAVTDARGNRLGAIERAAVRALGITTHAVHLIELIGEGRRWARLDRLVEVDARGVVVDVALLGGELERPVAALSAVGRRIEIENGRRRIETR